MRKNKVKPMTKTELRECFCLPYQVKAPRLKPWRPSSTIKPTLEDLQKIFGFRFESRVRHACKIKLSEVPEDCYMGCNVNEGLFWLQCQFQPGMTWTNRDQWDIDHIYPCSSFDLSSGDPAPRRQCFVFTNTRPMWKSENYSKGAKIIDESTILQYVIDSCSRYMKALELVGLDNVAAGNFELIV